MTAPDPHARPLSQVVRDLSSSEAQSMSLGEVVDALGASALAGLILVFGLACALPLPPGATTVFGLPLVLLSPQLLFDQARPWLPRRLRERRMSMADLRGAFQRMTPWLTRMEALSRPRLGFVVGVQGRRLIGLICTVFALVLILPIPLGNMLPATAVSVLSLALIQRDGAIAMAGYVLAAASVGVLVLAANLVGAVIKTGLSMLLPA
ncbi:MAG TPA: exopolysaccharide biosynthesis protein [Phenylobacterium sp.]|uniref:exopolysaccharide biosynthesis protein n=1 Tax=Phenylobacterium sp. TaxID=1871053 RepID=UPI002B45B17E|nr:exopolysaccharide biosynthesis protein [Phenylobacterium sp.]HKR86608.1 exopolysaccharide biosynthesis protein [Phenylobacterium sp.]